MSKLTNTTTIVCWFRKLSTRRWFYRSNDSLNPQGRTANVAETIIVTEIYCHRNIPYLGRLCALYILLSTLVIESPDMLVQFIPKLTQQRPQALLLRAQRTLLFRNLCIDHLIVGYCQDTFQSRGDSKKLL
eukprot:m.69557 g.69557  ORF g.69557 m.69557 type:complete len:131 (+) comp16029_c0_seq2:49-441(+)